MARICNIAFVVLALAALVQADFYMHNMRGSNNRLNENNDNRNSNNRLFDSQNNNRGGYNVGDKDDATAATTVADQAPMAYYESSILRLEWTSQHGSAHEHLTTETIFQYTCETQSTTFYGAMTGLRDGTTTTQSTTGNANDASVGRHETATYFTACNTRDRNGGLFTADQTLNGNTAQFTRQNTNGGASGLECNEERDYYPYWHPTMWRDIVVLTSNTSRCAMYQEQSENVLGRFYCTVAKYNNRAQCETNSGTWTQESSHNLAAPDCQLIQYARDNHLGNTFGGETMAYNWTIPVGIDTVAPAGTGTRCVLRGRYNITTFDYDGWNTYSDKNGQASPIKDNPTYNFGVGKQVVSVKLALNTDQYGRTFQDRSHTFLVKALPVGSVPAGGMLYNLNVRGRRGNIVEVYPAVEYDFIPNVLTVKANDRVHIQWTGSLTTPNGAGQGAASTDKSNIVCIYEQAQSIPLAFGDPACSMFSTLATKQSMATAGLPDPTTVDDELDNVPAYYDGGIQQIGAGVPGTYYYMCTRNNSFSNRDQKGRIIVVA